MYDRIMQSRGYRVPVLWLQKLSPYPRLKRCVGSANATADTVLINATLTTLGRAYFALIPSGEDVQLTSEDLVQNRTTVTSAKSQFLVHTLGVNGSYNFQEIVEALTPATLYDVFIITEASGNGKVRSEVIHHPRKVRTHALAPEVTKVVCFPLNASATALDISFKLDVEQEDIDRVKPETLSYFTYDLHYEVIALSDGKKSTVTASTGSVSTGIGAATRSTDDISALKNTTIRGIFSMRNFSSVEDFQAGLKETHYANITDCKRLPASHNVEHLHNLLCDRSPRDSEENAYKSGVFTFFSEEKLTISENRKVLPNGARPGKPVENTEVETFRQQFEITGLEDATPYSIVLLPETTKSFGLFGRAFNNLLEAHTNENASEVELRSARPLHGSITAIQLEVSMTKPKDILFLCLDPPTSTTENDQDVTIDRCGEVDRNGLEASRVSPNTFTFTVGNLSEDTEYHLGLYAENSRRNGVVSEPSEERVVRTYKSAPRIIETSARPTAASSSQIDAQVTVEPDSSCIVHYVVREAHNSMGTETQKPVDAATILEHSSSKDTRSQFHHRLPSSSSSFVSGGNVFTESGATNTNFKVQELRANMTYELFVVTETSRDGNSSGVLGELVTFNVTTHAIAPKIVLATVDPVDGSTDSVVITANLSHPGMLHYFLSDVDFADPAIISNSDEKRTPHELRGQVEVLEEHILMEIINGTNDTRPTDPLVFVHNTTVRGLKASTTYHVSLTTETYGSEGVFGEFPPPVLVNTHLGPPVIIPEKLSVHPVDGSSSALAIDFELDRFGDVHYALFFRGLVPDRSHEFDGPLEKVESKLEDAGNESISIWPPPISTFDLKNLNGSMLKEAKLEELGVGVWVNDTILVSREDITRGRMTHKEIDKLPANALFDVCLVSETAASGGILGWPSDGSVTACHRVVTHADYTNQSKVLDEISVHPIGGRTDGIRINLKVSKLLKAPQTTDGAFSSHRGEVTSAFKDASPGHGDGVVAAGMLSNITRENATALVIEQEMVGLEANHKYLLFFAYETSGSNGVFTWINPHKHRGNDSRTENDGIPVTTYEAAPRIPKAKATPTFGQTSRTTVKFDVACDSSNTSYIVLLATETAGAHGVLSTKFEELRVRTHAPAPKFTEFRLEPRTGSTTELVLTFALDRPGEVHYMLGASDNAEFNVTSPHNISSKGVPTGDRHGHSRDSHNYRPEIVRTRRSVTYLDSEYVELVDYLMPGTSYSLFIVSEALPADHGVYGAIHEVKDVSTFANAPILLAHAAYPTPGTTESLTVGFRMDAPGIVYFSAVAVKPWSLAHHVAKGSDRFGNRLALHDRLVAQKSLDVDKESMELESDSGWREMILQVPQTGVNYTVHLVTETKDSGGIYGTVATHAGVRAHSEATELVNVSVNPTDARVDALTVNITLRDRGHVHYVAVPSGRGSEPPSNDQSTELSVRASGRVDVNETTGDQKTGFVIAGLTEGTSYDLYFRSETFESFGVFGLWTKEAVTARTHGLPADVLPEAVECKVTPSCEQRGREACSRKANMCGKCLEGYGVEGDEEIPEANESCVKLTPDIKVKRGPKIKINGVTRNPNLHLSETESETQSEEEHEQEPVHPVPTEQVTLDQQLVDLDAGQHDTMQAIEELEIIQESKQEEPIESTVPVTVDAMVQEPLQEPMQEVLGQPELVEQPVEHQVPVPVTPDQHVVGVGLAEITAEQEPTPDVPETSGCPLNAQPTASGLCECIPGYEVDEGGTSCVLSRMATVAEAASSGAFDILNAHHQVPSHICVVLVNPVHVFT
ncbi:Immunoglobulin-like fold [Phytophthora cactorum]|nr:Immunoglobulin-like fold [Phytophthora cactorum]